MNKLELQSAQKQTSHLHRTFIVYSDDCENCIRQKAQNDELLSIYYRVQIMNNKLDTLHSLFKTHQNICMENEVYYNNLSTNLRSNAKTDHYLAIFPSIVYQIVAELLQNKQTMIKENKRFHQIIFLMTNQKSMKQNEIRSNVKEHFQRNGVMN